MPIETPLSGNQPIRYKGKTVGHAKRSYNNWIFVWNQTPFRVFSDTMRTAYGMSEGLKENLEKSPFDLVEVGNGTIPVGTLDDYDIVLPTHDCFEEPPKEAQRLVMIYE